MTTLIYQEYTLIPRTLVRDSSPCMMYIKVYVNIRFGGHGWFHICRTANLENDIFEIWYGITASGVFIRIRLVAAV